MFIRETRLQWVGLCLRSGRVSRLNVKLNARWCNGNTSDFGSDILGSSPSRVIQFSLLLFWQYWIDWGHSIRSLVQLDYQITWVALSSDFALAYSLAHCKQNESNLSRFERKSDN